MIIIVVKMCCWVLQSCFVAFFSNAHIAERALGFIKSMSASTEVRHKMYLHVCFRIFTFKFLRG